MQIANPSIPAITVAAIVPADTPDELDGEGVEVDEEEVREGAPPPVTVPDVCELGVGLAVAE
jgi:hypothetical protein